MTALVVSACGNPGPTGAPTTPAPAASGAPASAEPTTASASGSPAPTASPFPSDGAWGSLDVPPLEPTASFVATKRGASVVAADTAFTLTSLDGTPVAELATRITAEPAIRLVASGASGDQVTIRPASRLQAGQAYRFTLTRVDGSVAHRWAVTAATELHLVGSIPGDQTSGVPTDSAFEMTFDQSGVTAAAVERHFTISPEVKGRFEVHGRAVAFIPNDPLKARTVHTVTLRKGLPLEGTGQVLPADVTVRFETKSTTSTPDRLWIGDTLLDFAVGKAPIVEISFNDRNDDQRLVVPTTMPTTVHRLDTLDAVTGAWKRLDADLDWTVSGGAPVDTSRLTRVLDASLPVQKLRADEWEASALLRLPEALPRGWYVLTATYAGEPQQVLIQVANITAFAQVTTTKTVVWVNSVGTGRPIAGATVELASAAMGATDADGLRVAPTPAAASTALATGTVFLVVRAEGRTIIVPIGTQECGKCWDDTSGHDSEPVADPATWWTVLATDRQVFRPSDTIDAWGVIKRRADGVVPTSVRLSVEARDEWSTSAAPIVQRSASPTATGMFAMELPITDLPWGDYDVVLRADDTVIASRYVQVQPIIKPAFGLSLRTDKRAVLDGQSVKTTIGATFYEGTPVAGLRLRVGRGDVAAGEGAVTTTGVDGRVTKTVRLNLPDDEWYTDQWQWVAVRAAPTLPEEADIGGGTEVAVFRANGLLDTEARLTGSKLTVSGAVHAVDFKKMERLSEMDWDVDPRGAPRAGAKVRVSVTEVVFTRHKTGTTYDPITKTVQPVYESTDRRIDRGTRTATTRADGTFRLSMTVNPKHFYSITTTYTDAAGRRTLAEAWAARPDGDEIEAQPASIRPIDRGDEDAEVASYATGETIRMQVSGGHEKPAADRYLFLVASRGLRIAQVQEGPTFSTTFRAPWIPSADILAVRFNGRLYDVTDPYTVSFDEGTRALTVALTTDHARYEPGDTVRLDVRTTDAKGRPVATTVAVRAIDEKLYAIGFAEEVDLLARLYEDGASGFVAAGWSNVAATEGNGEGDTTGGGGDEGARSDFRDAVLFRVVTTGPDGRASVRFDVADDLTSWAVSAAAVTGDLRAGSTSKRIPVGLPFFAEAALAQEYLAGDRPFLRVRGYGSDLATDATVHFTVSSESLGLAKQTVQAKAFTAAAVRMPTLPVGTHTVRIAATTGSGADRRVDVLVRTFTVVPNRAVATDSATGPLVAGFRIEGGATGFTRLVLADAGRGRVVPTLLSMLGRGTGRADDALAASVARSVLLEGFGMTEAELDGGTPVGLAGFQDGGIRLLPYGSADLELSALAALSDDPAIDKAALGLYFDEAVEGEGEGEGTPVTRERRIVALTGRAALGAPVAEEVREASQAPKLSRLERAWLAIAALVVGDEALATSLERGLLEESGERLGPWVRVGATDREETAALTALVAITAAGIGDPLAADMDAYLESVPPEDTLVDLQRALAARSWAERTPAADAVAELTVDGATRRLEIRASEPVGITLTPQQRRTARLEPVSGSVVVSTTWESPIAGVELDDHGLTSFTRTITPAGTIGLTDVVIVEYRIRYGTDGDLGSWLVTDFVPSGLAPIQRWTPWYEDDERSDIDHPWRIVGQRVDFVVAQWKDRPTTTMRYVARVVTPGTFGWEPVAVQSSVVPTWGRMIDATTVKIATK